MDWWRTWLSLQTFFLENRFVDSLDQKRWKNICFEPGLSRRFFLVEKRGSRGGPGRGGLVAKLNRPARRKSFNRRKYRYICYRNKFLSLFRQMNLVASSRCMSRSERVFFRCGLPRCQRPDHHTRKILDQISKFPCKWSFYFSPLRLLRELLIFGRRFALVTATSGAWHTAGLHQRIFDDFLGNDCFLFVK